jgi:pimeloyl-ACP methyl ester carboxylesterase
LLLIHGFPLDHTLWKEQIPVFAQTHRVIAPDLRGFGSSPLPEPPPQRYSMADHAQDLVQLLDALTLSAPVNVCGLSMGGYIALAMWKQYADRIARLLLVHTRAIADSASVRAVRHEQAHQVQSQGTRVIAEGIRPRLFHPETAQQQPEVVRFIDEMMDRAQPAGVTAALLGMAERPDMTADLPNIRVPTLVLVGEADAISAPAEMKSIADAIPGSRFVQIAGAGHLSPVEQPAAFNAALAEFLAA